MKSRSMAGEACQRGKITLDGGAAKASREIRPGNRIAIDLGRGVLELEVTTVPAGNIPKARAAEYYRILHDARTTFDDFQ